MAEPTDDGRPWGHMEDGKWRLLPKLPMTRGALGPPPFSVVLPSGEVRHVIHDPNWRPDPLP